MKTRCGYVAIIGRPNVGKSTLLNHILGKKLAITSKKPQTTRHQILGIKTVENVQALYLDTPGLHRKEKNLMNRYMNKAARSVLNDANIIVWVVDALNWQDEDDWILKIIQTVKTKVILAVNKVDKIKDKNKLLPFLETAKNKFDFVDMIPISAKENIQLDVLEKKIADYLPIGAFLFKSEEITDRSDSFIAAEIVREKLTRFLGEELPYALTVTIEAFEKQAGIIKISAVIIVDKPGQKTIIIGKKGEQLKTIGTLARKDLEEFFGVKVFLKLWVKVKSSWADNEKLLGGLGLR